MTANGLPELIFGFLALDFQDGKMAKLILAFIIVFGVFFFGIKLVREMTGMEKWKLTKYVLYSTLCSVLSIGFLIALVILF